MGGQVCQKVDRSCQLHYKSCMKRKPNKPAIVLIAFCLLLPACQLPVEETATPEPTQALPTATSSATVENPPNVKSIQFETEEHIKEGDEALLFGDYAEAERIYADALANNSDATMQAMASYDLGLTYYSSDKEALALTIFENLIKEYPESLQSQRANFLVGEIYAGLGRSMEALEAYQAYLDARANVIDPFVLEKIGDIHVKEEDYTAAIEAYQAAYLVTKPGDEGTLAVKIASAYDSLGEDEVALSMYQDIYYNTDNPYTKAQMDLLMGRIHYTNGALEQAYAFYQDAVNNYPEAYDSYSALVTLVDDGQEVDEFQRGMINYNIGQYDLAIEAFDRYMSSPQADIAAGLYYKALTNRAMGLERANFSSNERHEANKIDGTAEDLEAIALWNRILNEFPSSLYYTDASEDIAYTYFVYMDAPEKAAEVALNFVASVPASPSASSILFSAGRYYEIAGNISQAADTWTRLGNEYPSSSETFQALFFAGMLYFRLAEYEKAQLALNKALVLSLDPLETSGAHLWLGIVHMQTGDLEAARDAWRAAKASDPNGYHGLRAQELLDGVEPFAPPEKVDFSAGMQSQENWGKEKTIAEAWLRTSFMVPEDIDLENVGELGFDERFIRGYEYWSLGLYEAGRAEFEALRNEYEADPVKTFQLLQTFLDLGYYRSAIAAGRSILKLSGLDEFNENAPKYFKLVIYGTYYQKWILPAADEYGIDPLLLYSLIHQESHFEGYVSSSAGARGLMQIMPETGAQIAGEIGWPEIFDEADLDIPYISLTLGTNYLRRQILGFEGDLYAALAAYNGGPGNALSWKEIAGDNPDLFLGSVRYLETRTYIRVINENYAQYRLLYGSK